MWLYLTIFSGANWLFAGEGNVTTDILNQSPMTKWYSEMEREG